MTHRFGQRDGPLGGRQSPLGDLYRTACLAVGTGLVLFEQAGLSEGQIFHDMPGDGLPDLARRGFDADKGRSLTGEVQSCEIDAEFFCNFFQNLLIFRRPGTVEHVFILELRT